MDRSHRLPNHCQLVGWIIGSSPVEREEYLGRLGYVGSRVWLGKHLLHTKSVGQSLVVGLINGLQVTVELL